MQKMRFAAAIAVVVLASQALVPIFAETGPGQGEVIFHRADVMKGKAVRFNLSQDGRPIGHLLAGTEIVVSLDPGTYTFTASAPSLDGTDQLTLTVEAGVTYHVEGEILWSWPVGRPKFKGVSQSGTPVAASAPAQPEPAPTATSPTPPPAPAPTAAQSNVSAAGLQNFVGDWTMDSWSLTADGKKLTGAGKVTVTAHGDRAIDLTITEFVAPDIPGADGGGTIRITDHPARGLVLSSALEATNEELNLTGRYESGKYVFYLIGGDGETLTGAERSSVRLEFESEGENTWVANTYSSVGGNSTHIQSARLSR